MHLGYNTNGFPHHRIEDTLAILAEIGYESVALTLEHDHLSPPTPAGVSSTVALLKPLLVQTGFRVTIETGARFMLDPRRKHQPTLVSASVDDRRRRIEFLKAAIDIAAELSADSVSLWSGTPDDEAAPNELFDRLTHALSIVLDHARTRDVRLSFEPEPGMFIDTMASHERLVAAVSHPLLGLTLDVGHIHCLGDGNLADHVRQWKDRLWNVHLEDMRYGRHEHMMFGEGEIDFQAVTRTLKEADYAGPVHVELSRHGHDAVNIARRSYEFLRPMFD